MGITAGEGCGDAVNFIATILVNTLIIGIIDDVICEEAFFTAVGADTATNAYATAIIITNNVVVVVVGIDAVIICS